MLPDKPNFTITEVAKIVGLTRPIVYKAIEDGSLRAWRTWARGTLRIRREDLDAWVSGKTTRSAAA